MEEEKKDPHVICIANHKGGVGKTTTAAALAYLFADRSKDKVMLIDADAQTNLTQAMQVSMDGKRDIRNAVLSRASGAEIPVDSFILPTQYQDIDMVPGSVLIESESFLSHMRKARLEDGINPWEELVHDIKALGLYDIIIMDLHPSVGLDTLLPMQACDRVLVPMEPDERSVAGLSQVYQAICKARRKANPGIRLLGYFFNKVKKNTLSAKEYIPSAMESIPKGIAVLNEGESEGICFKTVIRDSEDARKSVNYHCAVTAKYRGTNIATDFAKLYYEIREVL